MYPSPSHANLRQFVYSDTFILDLLLRFQEVLEAFMVGLVVERLLEEGAAAGEEESRTAIELELGKLWMTEALERIRKIFDGVV